MMIVLPRPRRIWTPIRGGVDAGSQRLTRRLPPPLVLAPEVMLHEVLCISDWALVR